MDLSVRKEHFSYAYIRAVSAAAGFKYERPEIDDDSVDCTISASGSAGLSRRPKVDAQVKCSARDIVRQDHLAFFLKLKNYDDLRARTLVPRILIVVVVPEEPTDWLRHSEEELTLRHCGYWMSLHGSPDTENESGCTVKIPRAQRFDTLSLQNMMSRIDAEGQP